MKSMLNQKLGNYDYTNSFKSNNKYSNYELEEAKNSIQHLGKGTNHKTGNSGNTLSNTGNYKKQFKPQLDDINKPGTGFSQRKEENYVIDSKPKMGSGTNLGSGRFNFSNKYGTSTNNGVFSNNQPFNQNVNPNLNKVGTYTSSKMASNKMTSFAKDNQINKINSDYNPKSYLTINQSNKPNTQINKQIFSKQLYREVDDNRPLKGER